MCKFEQIGAERQYESLSKYEADKNFRISCNICCSRGMKINCDHCGIEVAHSLVVSTFERSENHG